MFPFLRVRASFAVPALVLEQTSSNDKSKKDRALAQVKGSPAKGNFAFFLAVAIETDVFGAGFWASPC
jgi:hypothetical protein